MYDKDDKLRFAEIHTMVKTISVDLQFLRRHRNELVGFNVGHRRLYFQMEVYAYLSRLERENLKHPEQSMEQ